jgi:ATP-dependent RNA helicase DDX52/ROK1
MDTFSLLSGGLNFNPKVNNVSIFKPTIKPLVKKTENPTQTVTSENVGSIRKTNGIKVTGSDVPFPFLGFSDLLSRYSIDSYLYGNLMACGFNSPTPIQMQAIPVMFHGRELMACAPTGSGKTLAFLLSIIYHLKAPAKQGIRALIITPTRELAKQIHREFEKLTQGKGFKACVLSKSTNLDKHSVKIYGKIF